MPGAKIPGEEDDVYDNDFEDGDGGENGEYDEDDHDEYYDGDEEIMQGTERSHVKSAKLSNFMTPLPYFPPCIFIWLLGYQACADVISDTSPRRSGRGVAEGALRVHGGAGLLPAATCQEEAGGRVLQGKRGLALVLPCVPCWSMETFR